MPRKRTSKPTANSDTNIPLSQPDRSIPDPSQETLISWAEQRNLFLKDPTKLSSTKTGDHSINDDGDEDGEYQPGRLPESILWSASLVMVHFTLDFLVQHQYAQEMEIGKLVGRGTQAFPVILSLFYILHPHPQPSILPGFLPLSSNHDQLFRMILFFIGSVGSGCYLIHITNVYSYYAVMKQAAPVGCIWIWSVVELSLLPAAVSLLCCVGFLFWGNYAFL